MLYQSLLDAFQLAALVVSTASAQTFDYSRSIEAAFSKDGRG
jgi:hypothetical protein